jgi:hypothetical protein
VGGGGARVGDGDRARFAPHPSKANPPNPTHPEPGFFMPKKSGTFLNSITSHHELFSFYVFFGFSGSFFI